MENAEKILAVKKNSLKNRRAHLNENWVVLGWRRASADRLLLLLLLALYLHFFHAHRGGRACHFYFYFLFLFFGKSVGPAPPHMRGRSSPTESNYAMSTSGRTFKLALIKYWLHVVFSLTIRLFVRYAVGRPPLDIVQFVSASFEQVTGVRIVLFFGFN